MKYQLLSLTIAALTAIFAFTPSILPAQDNNQPVAEEEAEPEEGDVPEFNPEEWKKKNRRHHFARMGVKKPRGMNSALQLESHSTITGVPTWTFSKKCVDMWCGIRMQP